MRRSPLVAVTALAFAASTASAQINLMWNDCGEAGVAHRMFACDRNTGVDLMYASFIMPSGLRALIGMESVIEFRAEASSLTAWWHFMQAGSCRPVSITAQFDTPRTHAVDYWGRPPGGPMGAFDYSYGAGSGMATACGRLRSVCAVSALSTGPPIDPGTEVYAHTVRIDHQRTVGADACGGCTTRMCIVLDSIKLLQPADIGASPILMAPSMSNFLGYQSDNYRACLGAPITRSTWGQVKSLYR